MYEHKIIVSNDSAIKILEKEGYELCAIDNGKMYFKILIKKTNTSIIYKQTPELKEFIDKYKTIKKNGLYDKSLVKNYNECVKQGLHKQIMDNLDTYIKYLQVTKKQDFALMPTTYINRKRYLDCWDIVKDHSKKFLDEMFINKQLEPHIIDNVLTEISRWEVKNKPRELTVGIAENIINYVLNNGN